MARPAGSRLVRDVEAGVLGSVYVYRIDRLARNPRLLLNAVHRLEEAGCRLVSATESFDTGTPAGRAMLGMLGVFAGFERDSIVERCNNGTERAARDGVWLGGKRLFGYRIVGHGKESRLEVDPAEAETVRLIFRMVADERRSCGEVTKYLNAAGVPTAHRAGTFIVPRTGKPNAGLWTIPHVHNLLKNRAYYGVHEYGKQSRTGRELIRRPCPAIVDQATWERAQHVLMENRTYGPQTVKHHYLLRGLIRCGTCGKRYHGATYGRYRYYLCAGSRPGTASRPGSRCSSRNLPLRVEELVWADIEQFLRNPGEVLQQLAEQIEGGQAEERHCSAKLARLDVALAAMAEERNRVLTLYRKQRIDDAMLETQLTDIDREEAELRAARGECQRQAHGATNALRGLAQTEALLQQIGATLDERLPWEKRRRITELLVDRILVDERDGELCLCVSYAFQAPVNDGGRWTSMKERGLM
jgi:site-specific DNA recombinase